MLAVVWLGGMCMVAWAFALSLHESRVRMAHDGPIGARWSAMSSGYDGGDRPRLVGAPPLTPAQSRARDVLVGPRLQASIRRWLHRLMVPQSDRDDLAQDVTFAALRSLHTYNPEIGSLDRWVNRIAVHVAAHYRAKARHRREEQCDEFEAEDMGALPDERIEEEDRRRAVHAALLRIDPEDRAVLVAHDIDGEEMTSIGQRIGRPLSTTYKARARAMMALMTALRPEKG